MRFCREVLGVHPWRDQRAFLRAAAAGHRHITWGTGHGVGKTLIAACLMAWWLATGDSGTLVISSAPTNRQVELLLWRELRFRWGRSADLMTLGQPLRKALVLRDGAAAYGFSTDDPARFQGIHAPRLRVIVDEANEFDEDILTAIDSCLTGADAQLIMIGNTLMPTGRFHRALTDRTGYTLRTSSRQHPNVRAGRTLVSGAVTREWIADFETTHAHDPESIKARIDADFPDFSANGLISLSDWRRCRETECRAREPIVLSVDVARFGENLSVATLLRGACLVSQTRWGKSSVPDTADRVADLARDASAQSIVVDDDGLGGGVVDLLRRDGFPVVAFRGGMKPDEPERFHNRISEAYWRARELVENHLLETRDDNEKLGMQLAMRHHSLVRGGLIAIERKEEFCRRTGLPSPDEADSLAMGVHEVVRQWAQNQ